MWSLFTLYQIHIYVYRKFHFKTYYCWGVSCSYASNSFCLKIYTFDGAKKINHFVFIITFMATFFFLFLLLQIIYRFCFPTISFRKKREKQQQQKLCNSKKNIYKADTIGNCIMLDACPINQWENFASSFFVILVFFYFLFHCAFINI